MLWRINQEHPMAKSQSTRKRSSASKSRSTSSRSGRSRSTSRTGSRTSGRSGSASRSKSANRGRRGASQRQQDAIALLRADHKAVSGMFDEYERRKERLSPDKKLEMVQTICRELEVHTQIEEEIFYPAAREAVREQDLLDEAEIEHGSAKELIRQLQNGQPGDDLYDARVKVLGEYVKHHVKEEQNELFPMVKKSRLDIRELGEELKRRKEELMGAV
jgi:hemerythrin-like domain-containing protein